MSDNITQILPVPNSGILTFLRNETFSRAARYFTPGTPNMAIDLTSQFVRFHLRKDTSQTSFITLTSGDAPNANGSQIIVQPFVYDAEIGIEIQRIELLLTDEETGLIPFNRGYWRYDLDNAGEISRLAGGKAIIKNP